MTPPNNFDTARKGTGTKEWSEFSHNFALTCPHDCKYCYARQNAKRWGVIKADSEWKIERLKPGREKVKFTKKSGVIMIPTTTDIVPAYLDEAIRTFRGLLAAGNQLLIVSKPHLECIEKLCSELDQWKSQILFRFTIGTTDNDTAKFWEPGAPSISERMDCLKFAFKSGYATSVSCEPILGGHGTAVELVDAVESLVTDTIWIGKMNGIRRRVDCTDRQVLVRVQEMERMQRDSEMLRLYDDLRENTKIKFKDSIQQIVDRLVGV